ncbi:MAG: helix-turn-helix domain-containing protein [Gemmobacter sp.]
MDCPTPSESTIENTGEIRHLSNRFSGAENENPGALAGASGANVKALRLQSEDYTDVPGAARRVDQNGNWNRARWGWLKAVTSDADLSPMARLLAHVLATQFSHHETAHCAPGTDTLADALATSVDTIKRALRDLAAGGWLIRTEGRGRGNRSEIFFLGGNNVVPMICPRGPEASGDDRPAATLGPAKRYEKGGNSAPLNDGERAAQKGADMRGKGGKSALSHYKADPKNIQRERARPEAPGSQPRSGRPDYSAYDRAVAAKSQPPEVWNRPLHPIKSGSDAEADWNRWLAKNGHPTVAQVAPQNHAGEFGVPFRRPPNDDDAGIEAMLSQKWVRAFAHKAKDRANA